MTWPLAPMAAPHLFLLYILLHLDLTLATPSVTLPLNAQVPPVARVNQQFTFSFSSSSFTSSFSSLHYSAVGAPGWLHLDSAERTFFGVPRSQDNGSCTFDLIAEDESGRTTSPVTLVVTDSAGPSVNIPAEKQLSKFGTFSTPDTLIVRPGSPVSLNFDPETFKGTSSHTAYYATCSDNTPLPAWLHFNPQSFAFTGSVPEFSSPTELPQSISLTLAASNFAGFSDASITVCLYISTHQLSFGVEPLSINVTSGHDVEYNGIASALRIDNKPVVASDLQSVTARTPSWLSIDKKTLSLRGKAPDHSVSSQFDISVQDSYGDVANTTVRISSVSSSDLILQQIGPLKTTAGGDFNYTMKRDITASPSAAVSIDLGPHSSWLQYDPEFTSLAGHAPDSAQDTILNLTVTDGSASASQIIHVQVLAGISSATTSALATAVGSSRGTIIPAPTALPLTDSGSDATYNSQKIAAEVIIPVLGTLGLLFGLWIWWRRRRRRRSVASKPERRQIGRPIRPASAPAMAERTRAHRYSDAPQLELLSSGSLSDLGGHRMRSPERLHTADRSSKHESIVNFFQKALSPIAFEKPSRHNSNAQARRSSVEDPWFTGGRQMLQSKPQKYSALGDNPFAFPDGSRQSKNRPSKSQSSSLFHTYSFIGRGHGAVSRTFLRLVASQGIRFRLSLHLHLSALVPVTAILIQMLSSASIAYEISLS